MKIVQDDPGAAFTAMGIVQQVSLVLLEQELENIVDFDFAVFFLECSVVS